jgi:isochorismate synthase EntC
MQYDRHKLYFYAGCGITADSEPEKEWNETCYKMQLLCKLHLSHQSASAMLYKISLKTS